MLAEQIFDAYIEDCPQDSISILSLAGLDVNPCIGCDACKSTTTDFGPQDPQNQEDPQDPLTPAQAAAISNANQHLCVIKDEFQEIRKHIDAADEMIIISPLYFAGAPAQLKALMDRLQPYFWSDIRVSTLRRPMELHVLGEGGNPYGYDALVTTIRSAFGVAGFRLTRLLDWVGKIDPDGNITEDATETTFEDALL